MPDPIAAVIIALAVARLTILATRDGITEPFRHAIFLWSPPENDRRKGWAYQNLIRTTPKERKDARRNGQSRRESRWVAVDHEIRKAGHVGSLVSCPDCVGVWIGVGVWLAWREWPTSVEAGAVPLAFAMVASWIARRGGYA